MTAATIDTENVMEIKASPVKQAVMALAGLSFVALGYFMTTAMGATPRHSTDSVRFIGYLSMAFFGPVTLLILWQMFTQRGPVITLAPQGFKDIRVSADWVPWTAVKSLTTWENYGQRVMIVGLNPGEEDKLALTRIARLSRGANGKLGADGLAVTAQGTKIGHDALMEAAIAYVDRFGRG